MTDSLLSPLAQQADFVLLARSDMASVVDSLVAPLSLINAMIVATALKKKDEVSKTFQNLEEIWEDVYKRQILRTPDFGESSVLSVFCPLPYEAITKREKDIQS